MKVMTNKSSRKHISYLGKNDSVGIITRMSVKRGVEELSEILFIKFACLDTDSLEIISVSEVAMAKDAYMWLLAVVISNAGVDNIVNTLFP